MKAALPLLAMSTLNALTASPAPGDEFRPAKNAIAEGTHTRLVEFPTKGGFRGHREGRVDSTGRDFQDVHAQGRHAPVRDLKFTHLQRGLSQGYVTDTVQLGEGTQMDSDFEYLKS